MGAEYNETIFSTRTQVLHRDLTALIHSNIFPVLPYICVWNMHTVLIRLKLWTMFCVKVPATLYVVQHNKPSEKCIFILHTRTRIMMCTTNDLFGVQQKCMVSIIVTSQRKNANRIRLGLNHLVLKRNVVAYANANSTFFEKPLPRTEMLSRIWDSSQ